jgi:hypothetical protein
MEKDVDCNGDTDASGEPVDITPNCLAAPVAAFLANDVSENILLQPLLSV